MRERPQVRGSRGEGGGPFFCALSPSSDAPVHPPRPLLLLRRPSLPPSTLRPWPPRRPSFSVFFRRHTCTPFRAGPPCCSCRYAPRMPRLCLPAWVFLSCSTLTVPPVRVGVKLRIDLRPLALSDSSVELDTNLLESFGTSHLGKIPVFPLTRMQTGPMQRMYLYACGKLNKLWRFTFITQYRNTWIIEAN